MPTKLDDHLVSDALSVLRDWSGGTEEISRTVSVPEPAVEVLVERVTEAARGLDHQPRVERRGQGWFLVALTTPSVGGVSDYDIALATRIDDLVRDAGGEVRHEHGDRSELLDVGSPTAAE